jgi:aspartyl-tRNA(Asn)/glutamyl-tRNA(Gln) amidotransferase subunit B
MSLADVLSRWEPVIGLEVHVQLATKTKIFSPSSAAFGIEPNGATDPLVLALPGTLPRLNRAAVDMAVRLGLAVGGHVRPECRFSRKHYFYPDLPKGYQISQFDEPIIEGGGIEFLFEGKPHRVALTRIHMEEDAGKNIHASDGRSLVDYNRAGVPLCEVVSEPDLRSAEEAAEYVRALRVLVRTLGICDGNMEEGSLRCDANVSIRPRGTVPFGTRAELKNINSFKNVKDAVTHEILRQAALLERGEKVVQETRLWDANRGVSQSMRSKEDAHDYRYFPEPDLPPIHVDEAWLADARSRLPELPMARMARYQQTLGLPEQDAVVLSAEREIGGYFDAALAQPGMNELGKKLANWVMNELLSRVTDPAELVDAALPIPPANLAELVLLVEKGTLSGKLGKEVFAKMWDERLTASAIVQRDGLAQVSDSGELEGICAQVVAANPDEVARFRAGDKKLQGFFVGQIMKQTGGKANPKAVSEILGRLLK